MSEGCKNPDCCKGMLHTLVLRMCKTDGCGNSAECMLCVACAKRSRKCTHCMRSTRGRQKPAEEGRYEAVASHSLNSIDNARWRMKTLGAGGTLKDHATQRDYVRRAIEELQAAIDILREVD